MPGRRALTGVREEAGAGERGGWGRRGQQGEGKGTEVGEHMASTHPPEVSGCSSGPGLVCAGVVGSEVNDMGDTEPPEQLVA